MKKPCCWLCGRDCHDEQIVAELVRFRDYEPLPEGFPGHPRGLEWFCPDHAPAAQELANLDSSAVLTTLQQRFGIPAAEVVPIVEALSYLVVFDKEGALRFVILGVLPGAVRKQDNVFGVWQLPLDMLKAYSLVANLGWLPDTPYSIDDVGALLDKLRAAGHSPTPSGDQAAAAAHPDAEQRRRPWWRFWG
jgi:hypothetical protein